MIRAHIDWHLWLLTGLPLLLPNGWKNIQLFWSELSHFHLHSLPWHSCFRICALVFIVVVVYHNQLSLFQDTPFTLTHSHFPSFPLKNSFGYRKQWVYCLLLRSVTFIEKAGSGHLTESANWPHRQWSSWCYWSLPLNVSIKTILKH